MRASCTTTSVNGSRSLNIEIDQIAAQVESEQTRARIRTLAEEAGEIASDVHGLAYDLHPSKLQMLGLVAAIQSLCNDASQHAVCTSPSRTATSVGGRPECLALPVPHCAGSAP